MSTTTTATFTLPAGTPATARTVFKLLERMQHGSLSVQLPDGSVRRFGTGSSSVGAQGHASIYLHNWKVLGAALKSGDIGFAESYIAGDWSTPNLTELLKVLISNRTQVEDIVYGSWAGRLLYRARHLFNRNTRANSQNNIHAHYDLGNDFYQLWLDASMNYSSALFEQGFDQPLADAQQAKMRRALRMAGVRPGERLLEIGCGWGALAQTAVDEFDAQVTGVTLSTEQLSYGRRRLQPLARGAQAELRLQDYRDIADAPFDAICSIEMVEAVGREYWPTYFQTVRRLLKPGGRACIQTIVIDDALFQRYIGSTDFIQQYVFPGGCLPCPDEFRRHARAAGLELVDSYSFGLHYAETLRRWRDSFMAERQRVHGLGFDERFCRIWEFYLAYCEAAFEMGNTDVVQFTLQKKTGGSA